jgi:hypothetical protein
MQVRFQARVKGYKIDRTVCNVSADLVVRDLRCALADTRTGPFKCYHVGGRNKGLDPRAEGAWTDEQFYQWIVKLYNDNMLPKGNAPIVPPADACAFIRLSSALGMAEQIVT